MDKEKFIRENIVYFLLVVFVFVMGAYSAFKFTKIAYESYSSMTAKKAEMQTKQEKLAQLKAQKAQKVIKPKDATSGKVIYEVPQFQFSPEASFGIMFENILANVANSGVRVRSIGYNYKPTDDKVLNTNMEGYNACELSFTAVGTYTQLQNFFKSIAKEKYLSSLYEVYIEPYDKDKTKEDFWAWFFIFIFRINQTDSMSNIKIMLFG